MKQHTSPLTLASLVCRSATALSSNIGDETVLMSLERGNYYGLDTVATDIWQRLEEPVNVAGLCDQLLKEYDADPSTVRQDVLNLLERLRAEGFLEIRG